jgi:exodeoxyribonuclease VII small subunit
MNKKNETFEAGMERLEQIVRLMEKGEVTLDDSLKLFQEGTQLVERCGKLLDEAQMQVDKITAGADGEPVKEAFTDE